jgi:hypothetical protein
VYWLSFYSWAWAGLVVNFGHDGNIQRPRNSIIGDEMDLSISLFAMQPFEPSDGCLVLHKLMANGQ